MEEWKNDKLDMIIEDFPNIKPKEETILEETVENE